MSRCVIMPCLVCDLDFVPMSACPLHILDGCIMFYTFACVWHGYACIGPSQQAQEVLHVLPPQSLLRPNARLPLFGVSLQVLVANKGKISFAYRPSALLEFRISVCVAVRGKSAICDANEAVASA